MPTFFSHSNFLQSVSESGPMVITGFVFSKRTTTSLRPCSHGVYFGHYFASVFSSPENERGADLFIIPFFYLGSIPVHGLQILTRVLPCERGLTGFSAFWRSKLVLQMPSNTCAMDVQHDPLPWIHIVDAIAYFFFCSIKNVCEIFFCM